MSRRAWDSVEAGDQLPPISFTVGRADLVRYAGASGDFNTIHWNESFAKEVGLPDVLAHGMLTMAQSVRIATEWAGDPDAVVSYTVKFTRPVIVPDDGHGATVEVTGTVAEKLDGNCVKLNLTANFQGQSVLGRANAVVRLA